MIEAIQISSAGMRAHQDQINTISQNVANISTNGYRRQIVSFVDLSMSTAAINKAAATGQMEIDSAHGAGSKSYKSLSTQPGELKHTGEILNFAIDGDGFIEVERPDGSLAYTRDGGMTIDSSGNLQIGSGNLLAAHINIPANATSLQIMASGEVKATIGGDEVSLGQIDLVAFSNPASMVPVGQNLFVASDSSGELAIGSPGQNGLGLLRQGYLESSNVQMTDELVSLMMAQRAFEMNSRVAQAADQIESIINNLMR